MKQSATRPVILLADDDEPAAAAWSTALRMNGWDVVWAPTGDAALALARTARPDLLITDWNMPGMDGPALCRAFREDPTPATVRQGPADDQRRAQACRPANRGRRPYLWAGTVRRLV